MLSIGRLLRLVLALGVSVVAGWLFLTVAVTTDPDIRRALVMMLGEESLRFSFPPPRVAFNVLDMAMLAFWMGAVFICAAPVIVVATIGEAARTRSFLWYGIGTGTLAAAMPSILRTASGANERLAGELGALELRWLTIFFLTGVVCGALYWLLAGRSCGPGDCNR